MLMPNITKKKENGRAKVSTIGGIIYPMMSGGSIIIIIGIVIHIYTTCTPTQQQRALFLTRPSNGPTTFVTTQRSE